MSKFQTPIALTLYLFSQACSPESVAQQSDGNVERPVKTLIAGNKQNGRPRAMPGLVSAPAQVELSFRVEGPIIALPVDEGQKTKKGTILARIDPRDYRVAVSSAKATLNATKARLKHAQTEFKRTERLVKNKTLPSARLDDVEASLEVAKAQVVSAEQAVANASLRLKDTVLKAPYDGKVASHRVETYTSVNSRQEVLLYQKEGPLEVHVDVSESLIKSFIKAKSEDILVSFPTLGDSRHKVRISSYEAEADASTQTYQVVLVLNAAIEDLEPGMTAVIYWQPSSVDQIVLPISAVSATSEGTPIVYLVQKNRLKQVSVTLGEVTDEGVIILSGVKVGDTLLAAGLAAAYDGRPVHPIRSEDLGG